MKSYLTHTSSRCGHYGWALRVKGETEPLCWTVCTTRKECREIRDVTEWMRTNLEIVKVKIKVEAVCSHS